MKIETLAWKKNKVKLIDQTKLPGKLKYIYINDIKRLWKAIKSMQVRGAPALGAASGLGVYLGIRNSTAKNFTDLLKDLNKSIAYISSSRPTARNLFWALERIKKVAIKNKSKELGQIKKAILDEAKKIIREDQISCRAIGRYGEKLIRDKDTVLTICNAGILATIDYGTALGVLYKAKEEGKRIKVFACETRPLFQGARLTAWELKNKGIDVTLIADSMAATLMEQGKIDKVIVGADRIAANGDTANKIGTYALAVLSSYHNIPFYVAAPLSTFDNKIKSGNEIPIEERSHKELTGAFFKKEIASKEIKVYNPAFDVTPHNLISAIITDKCIIRAPFVRNIAKILDK